MSQAQEIIDTALQAVKRGQSLFKEKIQEARFTDEEAEKLATDLLKNLAADDLNIEKLMDASQQFSDHILGPHKRNLAALQYGQLKNLAKLGLDDYVTYYEALERLNRDFMCELTPLLTQKFEDILIPAVERLNRDSEEAV